MKATPGGKSSCSEGRKAGPFRLRELCGRCSCWAEAEVCRLWDCSNSTRSLTPSTVKVFSTKHTEEDIVHAHSSSSSNSSSCSLTRSSSSFNLMLSRVAIFRVISSISLWIRLYGIGLVSEAESTI